MPTRSRIAMWCAASGLLWALAWPAIGGITVLAFVAWLPLLHAERLHDQRTMARHRPFFPYVVLAAFIWNLACSWWFYCVSEPLSTRLISVGAPVLVNTILMALPWWLKRLVQRSHGTRVAGYALILFWLAFERFHHDWDLQWPWFSIGNVFGTRPTMVQWYECTGMLGGSLWVLLANLAIDGCITSWHWKGRAWIARVIGALCIVLVPWCASVWLFADYGADRGTAVEVVVVQPNIDPYREKFGGMDPMDQLERMLTLAESRITDSTRLVVFPETALQEGATVDMADGEVRFNGLWENDLGASRSVMRLKAFQELHRGVALLCGMNSDRWFGGGPLPEAARPLGDGRHWYEAYNAALWMPAQGAVVSYHKSKLVAGPETMPFEEVLGPLSDLALDLGGTTGTLGQQEERSVLHDATNGLAVAPAICYESVFGEHVAAHVRNGANLIAIMTNDGWWDDSPGFRQHLTFASLRAIETRRSIVRSANTGISCIVDQRGIIHQASAWWEPAVIRATVFANDRITPFTRYGDSIGRVATWSAVLVLAMSVVRWLRLRST